MININENTEGKQYDIKKVIKGSIIAIIITLIMLLVFSMLLTYTSIPEKIIPTVIIVISALSILIGSQMATLNIRKNGIINGCLVGIIYISIIYVVSSITNGNFTIGLNSAIMMISSVVAGGIGGVVGVNMK